MLLNSYERLKMCVKDTVTIVLSWPNEGKEQLL